MVKFFTRRPPSKSGCGSASHRNTARLARRPPAGATVTEVTSAQPVFLDGGARGGAVTRRRGPAPRAGGGRAERSVGATRRPDPITSARPAQSRRPSPRQIRAALRLLAPWRPGGRPTAPVGRGGARGLLARARPFDPVGVRVCCGARGAPAAADAAPSGGAAQHRRAARRGGGAMTAPARDGARPREQTAPASRSSDGAILVTLFPDVRARTCRERTLTLPDLAQLIRTTVASEKARLPLLKLARLGTARSPAGSLRHDGNVIAVTGIEADYDGGAVGPDEAIEVAAKAGLRALIYTTPSHTPQRPRWRLLCPTSGELPPAERRHLVGRVNGLYRGIFAAESWTLSQAYYFGTVTGGPPPLVAVIDGMPIDRLDELDEAWLGPPAAPARPHGAAVAPMPRGPMSEDAVQRVIDRALARVRAAPDGAKHHTLRNAALLVGGVLDRARLGDGDAVRLLLGALPA